MPYKFIEGITNFTKLNDCLQFNLAKGKLRLHVLADDLIRIRFTQEAEFEKDFSYSVDKTEWQCHYELTETEKDYTVTTRELKTIIQKVPLRITFLDKSGHIISEDEPGLGIGWEGTEVQAFKKIDTSEKFFGLGEKTGNLDKRDNFYKMWNTDRAYSITDDPLYTSIPFFIGMRSHKAYGYFLDNTYETFFNMGTSQDRYYSFGAKHGELNYYFFYGPQVSKVVERYTELTGRMSLPPKWSLGYQQCRWSYYPDYEVRLLADTFRHKKIPIDVIYLDIDWMDEFRVFEWSRENFPEPKQLVSDMAEKGIKIVTILDPGVKADNRYHAAKSGLEGKHFVTYPDGEPYRGEVWPGWSYFPDFTRKTTRDWWGGLVGGMVETGIKGFWNDMNEPAVWGQAFPDIVSFEYEGLKKGHKAAHNIYGTLMARATFEGARKHLKGERVLNITRAGFAGVQRYCVVWTGDNESSEDHYRLSALMVMGLGLSGVQFTGPDVGGFNKEPSKELFAKWMQLGVFFPFYRSHSMIDTKDQEPWSFGEKIEENMRVTIKQRYELIPYLYTTLYHAHKTGKPVVKPLFWFHQDDENVYLEGYQYQFYCGEDIMVVPARVEQDFVKVYLPKGLWYSFYEDQLHTGKRDIIAANPWTRLPVFVRAGAVIPTQEPLEYTDQKPLEKVILRVYPGADSIREFYEDDGKTYDYEKGNYLLRDFVLKSDKEALLLSITHKEGTYKSAVKEWEIRIHGVEAVNELLADGKRINDYELIANTLIFSVKEGNKLNIDLRGAFNYVRL